MWPTKSNGLNDSIQPDMKLTRIPNTVTNFRIPGMDIKYNTYNKYCIAQKFEY